MSSFAVTVEEIAVHPHPNADRLELAQVGGYRAVVAKGAYTSGEFAVYIPEQAVLPDTLIAELGLTGKLAGKGRNRVKAVRLRGELSQGIVCRPQVLADRDLAALAAERVDLAETLSIVKWVPPVPVSMSGRAEPAAELLRWDDIENIKRYPNMFAAGEPVVATEKVHGTCGQFTYLRDTGTLLVTSKGLGAQRLALVADESNLYWRAARTYELEGVAAALAEKLGAVRLGLFGEIYGSGIQDLSYCREPGDVGFALFDLAYDPGDGSQRFVDAAALTELVSDRLPTVPLLYTGPYDESALWRTATGREQLSGTESHLREGLVVRAACERRSPLTGGRAVAKFVTEEYLTRTGGTEYE